MAKEEIDTMEHKTKNFWLIKIALKISGGKMWRDLDKASKNIKKTEHRVLMDIVNYAKNTEYGRKYGFDKIKNADDWQKIVPIVEYEDIAPYIKRQAAGEVNVIVPEKPVMYATTSGTTKEPKLIPITPKYYKECYNSLSKLWFYSVLKEHPDIFKGPEMSIVGRAVEGYSDDGTPIGSISGSVYENIPEFLKSVHVLPPAVHQIQDYMARYYCLMRITIEYSIRFIVTGNPTTLLELNNTTQANIDNFIEDIEKGTLKEGLKIEPNLRKEIEAVLSPNPKRANELRALKEKHSVLYPKHYWPKLELINTWKCGNSGLYLEHTKDFYSPQTKVREFCYLATEARAGIVLYTEQMASIMASHLLFFEFIKEEDINEEKPRVYLASELEKGTRYYILVTTPSGLYRYNMNDIMLCEDFYNEFPMLRFIQKGAGVTSLTGEKLHETQFLEAVNEVSTSLSMPTHFHIAFADVDTVSYHVFAEFTSKQSQESINKFSQKLDEALRKINIEYDSKRGSNRVKPLVVHQLTERAFEKFKGACMDKGYRDGQFKLTHLMIDKRRMNMFEELSITP